MYVTLKEHLARLEAIESSKPNNQRRKVPSMAALAKAANVATNTVSRWVTGETRSTDHGLASAIIAELREQGFPADISDILAYRENE